MERGRARDSSLYIIVTAAILLALVFAACGSDEAAPSDPATTSVIPDFAFFNTGYPSPVVLFEGRATDNYRVQTVLISFNNGADWNTAQIDNTSPNTLWNVAWSYLASPGEIPDSAVVLLKAIDAEANETTSSPIAMTKVQGNTVPDLLGVFTSASAGQIIALSSGYGGAYGDSAASLTIPVGTDLTVLGAGYGDALTSGGVDPGADSTATVLEAAPSVASLFSVAADLKLKKLRVLGSAVGVRMAETPGSDPVLEIEDCLFDRQGAWAVYARDDDGGSGVGFLSSIVDAGLADSSTRGGLYLYNVVYRVEDSKFYYHTDPGGPGDSTDSGAAVEVVDGGGEITGSLFQDNALAVWAIGSAATLTSCTIDGGAADPSYGVNLAGGPVSPVVRGNLIDGNTGYGLRIGTNVTPTVRRNVISNNGLSGIFIDFGSSTSISNVDLGTSTDRGYNDLFGNTHPGVSPHPDTIELYVSSGSGTYGNLIPAAGNYWGVNVSGLVPSHIYDGVDVHDRASVNYNTPYTFPQN